jgi:hypothetical protein
MTKSLGSNEGNGTRRARRVGMPAIRRIIECDNIQVKCIVGIYYTPEPVRLGSVFLKFSFLPVFDSRRTGQ